MHGVAFSHPTLIPIPNRPTDDTYRHFAGHLKSRRSLVLPLAISLSLDTSSRGSGSGFGT